MSQVRNDDNLSNASDDLVSRLRPRGQSRPLHDRIESQDSSVSDLSAIRGRRSQDVDPDYSNVSEDDEDEDDLYNAGTWSDGSDESDGDADEGDNDVVSSSEDEIVTTTAYFIPDKPKTVCTLKMGNPNANFCVFCKNESQITLQLTIENRWSLIEYENVHFKQVSPENYICNHCFDDKTGKLGALPQSYCDDQLNNGNGSVKKISQSTKRKHWPVLSKNYPQSDLEQLLIFTGKDERTSSNK